MYIALYYTDIHMHGLVHTKVPECYWSGLHRELRLAWEGKSVARPRTKNGFIRSPDCHTRQGRGAHEKSWVALSCPRTPGDIPFPSLEQSMGLGPGKSSPTC